MERAQTIAECQNIRRDMFELIKLAEGNISEEDLNFYLQESFGYVRRCMREVERERNLQRSHTYGE